MSDFYNKILVESTKYSKGTPAGLGEDPNSLNSHLAKQNNVIILYLEKIIIKLDNLEDKLDKVESKITKITPSVHPSEIDSLVTSLNRIKLSDKPLPKKNTTFLSWTPRLAK